VTETEGRVATLLTKPLHTYFSNKKTTAEGMLSFSRSDEIIEVQIHAICPKGIICNQNKYLVMSCPEFTAKIPPDEGSWNFKPFYI
jgi:hypothetical protein